MSAGSSRQTNHKTATSTFTPDLCVPLVKYCTRTHLFRQTISGRWYDVHSWGHSCCSFLPMELAKFKLIAGAMAGPGYPGNPGYPGYPPRGGGPTFVTTTSGYNYSTGYPPGSVQYPGHGAGVAFQHPHHHHSTGGGWSSGDGGWDGGDCGGGGWGGGGDSGGGGGGGGCDSGGGGGGCDSGGGGGGCD
ncbi:uncharacterized protein LOC143293117 isoform X1 [Babylonia areolata]|uniref:uncharacterized protein LOC143293117 isoform X1 n=1 Tax=Babylonia areolata TaxID=304850 RepID=UPI003FD1E55C